ncbi:hypothetical protein D3C72_2435980 [compost metagenome]
MHEQRHLAFRVRVFRILGAAAVASGNADDFDIHLVERIQFAKQSDDARRAGARGVIERQHGKVLDCGFCLGSL